MAKRDERIAELQTLALLMADRADDQGDVIRQTITLMGEIADVLAWLDAGAGLLEARVQMLEADNA